MNAQFWVEYHFGDEALSEFVINLDSEIRIFNCSKKSSTDVLAPREWIARFCNSREFVIYSTEDSYPLCYNYMNLCVISEENDGDWECIDTYMYYVPEETARRFAEARKLDAFAQEVLFGDSLPSSDM